MAEQLLSSFVLTSNKYPFVFSSGAHTLTLSKIVPHICNLLGDPNSQVSVFSEKEKSRVVDS